MADNFFKTLKDRRAAIATGLELPLIVPRWQEQGGPWFVMVYRPLDHDELGKVSKLLDQKGNLVASREWLARACIRVELKDAGEDTGSYTLDTALADAFGVPDVPEKIVGAIYLTDSDVTRTVEQLSDWSGQESERLDQELAEGE